ncbi:MAG: hypothetical protein NVSMB6_08490 [Burkholderiaceae bacterium]
MPLSDFDLVLFGGGGDLAMRKLLPALYARDRAKDLPAGARLICAGRHEWTREEFIAAMDENARPHISDACFDEQVWEAFCGRITYIALDAEDLAT